MDIQDKSLQYLALDLKQKNRQLIVKGVTRPTIAAVNNTIARKDEVAEQEIEKRQINADANYSIVQLNLSQNALVRKEIVSNYYLADYDLSFGRRMMAAFLAGWSYVLNFLIAITHLWGFIVIGLLTWFGVVYYQKTRKGIAVGTSVKQQL